MFLWFVGASLVLVYAVFQSPALDYRMVALGSVLPLLDTVTGGPWLLHTLVFSVGLLGVVMFATRHRRLVRRRWLGLPIGTFVHLVLDGVWTNSQVFWWPFLGASFGHERVPELDHGAFGWLLELAGVAALVHGYRRFGFDDRRVRARFVSTGQLPS